MSASCHPCTTHIQPADILCKLMLAWCGDKQQVDIIFWIDSVFHFCHSPLLQSPPTLYSTYMKGVVTKSLATGRTKPVTPTQRDCGLANWHILGDRSGHGRYMVFSHSHMMITWPTAWRIHASRNILEEGGHGSGEGVGVVCESWVWWSQLVKFRGRRDYRFEMTSTLNMYMYVYMSVNINVRHKHTNVPFNPRHGNSHSSMSTHMLTPKYTSSALDSVSKLLQLIEAQRGLTMLYQI